MDNLCHALAGAAIAQTGFARRLPRATILGVIAANIPDVDAFTYLGADSATAVAFRRGWTHGLPALLVWAVALAALFAWFSRRWPRSAMVGDGTPSVRMVSYLSLTAIAVASHPVLDWMNTYGVRFLMPFSDEWFYGDTLFIVDPVLLALFGLGWFLSSRLLAQVRARAEWPARGFLVAAVLYIAAMKGLSESTRAAAAADAGIPNPTPRQLMVTPRAFTFFTRDVLVASGGTYVWTPWRWNFGQAAPMVGTSTIRTGNDPGVMDTLRATRDGANFLRWSRFPYVVRERAAGTIFLGDVRYSRGTEESWAGIRVRPGTTTTPAAR
jgi:inner membrane protein